MMFTIDPLTWSYVKLFGHQINDSLCEGDGLPNSHIWTITGTQGHYKRLLTKAQIVGVLVSINIQSERVEFMVDDGTNLICAVLWTSAWSKSLLLGDLVHIEGKLNVERGIERELRILRISKLENSNEEMLHWMDVVELTMGIYNRSTVGRSIGGHDTMEHSRNRNNTVERLEANMSPSSVTWDLIARRVFFYLSVDKSEEFEFLNRVNSTASDVVLLRTIRKLTDMQRTVDAQETFNGAIRVTFPKLLQEIMTEDEIKQGNSEQQRRVTRSLRHVFAILRSSGILFLENLDTDQHVLLSFKHGMAPLLLTYIQDQPVGTSLADIADYVLTQSPFQRVPLHWLERSLQNLVSSSQIRQDDMRFYYISPTKDSD